MNAGRIAAGAALVAGLALSAGDASACGHGATVMAAPMAGSAVAVAVALPTIGMAVEVLPPGHVAVTVNGIAFFRAGPAWYQPFQGPMGPMFRVVPAPHGM
jgi:hypothetical protein